MTLPELLMIIVTNVGLAVLIVSFAVCCIVTIAGVIQAICYFSMFVLALMDRNRPKYYKANVVFMGISGSISFYKEIKNNIYLYSPNESIWKLLFSNMSMKDLLKYDYLAEVISIKEKDFEKELMLMELSM